ncbi:TPA: hypothetical protein ACXI1D_002433 [Proteus mirabilis]
MNKVNRLELRCIQYDNDTQRYDFNFYVDGKGLDEWLGFDRQTDWRFLDFDFDIFIQSTVKPRPSGRGYKARFFN